MATMLYKKYILQIFFLFIATSIYAESKNLIVFLKTGTQICLPVTESPKITFNGSLMCIGNNDYSIENVAKWVIADPDNITQSVGGVHSSGTIIYNNGILIVGKQSNVKVYNMAGAQMPVRVKNGQVDMTALPQGTYVINVGGETLKIRKQ